MQVENGSDNSKINKFTRTDQNALNKEDKFTPESEEIGKNVKAHIEKIAKEEGFNNYKIHAKKCTPDGNNFLAILTEITITEKITGEKEKKLELFVKEILPDNHILDVVNVGQLYKTELYMYREIAKIYTEFQNDAKIPIKERYNFVKTYEESSNRFIIMENLAKNGFGIVSRTDIITLQYAEKSIESLAKLHTLSFVLQTKCPDYFNQIMELKYPVEFKGEWEAFFATMCNTCLTCLEGSAQERFKNYMPLMFEKTCNNFSPEQNVTRCLCHGDFKTGNLLVKETDGEIEMTPVDYQLIYYGSPIVDMTYFIFTTTDKEFRRKHLDHLKNYYYNSMENFSKYFDIHIEDVYSRVTYEEEFKEKLDSGLLNSIWALPFFLASEESVTDFGESKISEMNFPITNLLRVRFQEIVDDFIEWGYL